MTYEEIADQAGLTGNRKARYVRYMRTRWRDTEEQKCNDGYAYEWAERFFRGAEYGASDASGQNVLDVIDAEFASRRVEPMEHE